MKPSLQLYRNAVSGHCHRVELFLSLLGLPFESIDVDLAQKQHKAPDFLAMNPLGQIPVLCDGELTLAEVANVEACASDLLQGVEGEFDLIVLSEIGYYLDPAQWLQVIEQAVASLSPGGALLACHWLHPIDGCPQDGREVHALLARHLPLYPLLRHEEADFLLEYWTCQPSVVDLNEPCP